MAFGLNGYEEFKGKEIAKELKISEGLVSQKIKKITKWIKQDADLCEMLQNLF
jgi:DNA-directed RNA polymerase specialized sigma subunit